MGRNSQERRRKKIAHKLERDRKRRTRLAEDKSREEPRPPGPTFKILYIMGAGATALALLAWVVRALIRDMMDVDAVANFRGLFEVSPFNEACWVIIVGGLALSIVCGTIHTRRLDSYYAWKYS